MTAQPPNVSPKIFISYAWENQATAKQLQQALQAAGAEVFVDYERIRGGDILPIHISRGLDWCDTLILLWSEHAKVSHWVQLEWPNALVCEKNLIPCKLDEIQLPTILRSRLYIELKNFDHGLNELLAALRLKRPATIIPEPKIVLPVQSPTLQLRSQPVNNLTEEAVKAMLKKYDFYCAKYDWNKDWRNPQGKGIKHNYELQHDGKVVMDQATGLMWQQAGSSNSKTYADTEKYIRDINYQRFADYNDWRLPTLEEAMSLMEREEKNGALYIDSVFADTQCWIWTIDKHSAGVAWVVYFRGGSCRHDLVAYYSGFVRVVR